MGRSYMPKYRIEFSDQGGPQFPQAWRVREYGKPTTENIEKWVHSLVDSMKIGGVNEHISRAVGYIPVPNRAKVVNQYTGETVATWTAPMFMAI